MFGGARVNVDIAKGLGQSTVSALHESVHYGDLKIRPEVTGEPNLDGYGQGIDDPRYGNSQTQIGALQLAADAWGKSGGDISEFVKAYPRHFMGGRATYLEIGYSFENAAFGKPVVTKQDYETFTKNYLKGAK